MNNKISREELARVSSIITQNGSKIDNDYIYEIYDAAYDGILTLLENQNLEKTTRIDSFTVISYIIGEYLYSTAMLDDPSREKFLKDENIMNSMASVAADKYLSLSLYRHKEASLTNKYLPPISSMNLYLNLMLNILNAKYQRNNPKNTLIVDLLNKSLSISQSIIQLLCDGYETEAFAMWRTLHECECTLIILEKYGDLAINSYLKHMGYGLAYKNALSSKEEIDQTFEQIKKEMGSAGLKSKDTKKYIEYGWLYPIVEKEPIQGFKLNFRDGLETIAGLHNYSELYMTSSEILHSTPLLIYSNKQYFYYITLLNLYESFFRIEKVFTNLFLQTVGEEERNKYIEMRKLYYAQLVNIHKREALGFRRIQGKKKE